MEIKNIHTHADWFTSYMNNDAQGEALIKCQTKKIKQLSDVLDKIKGEVELADDPKEFSERMVLDSIRALIDQVGEVEHKSGYFKWVG